LKTVFISIPSKGTVENEKLKGEFLSYLAKLQMENPDCALIAPMVQQYQLLPYMPLEPTWEQWCDYCRAVIGCCQEVWVLQFDGHDTSVGVAGEIAHADRLGVKVVFKNPHVD
jgi:hypothetical protein